MKTKKIEVMLTSDEANILNEIFNFYIENKLNKEKEQLNVYMHYAHDCGLIASSGEAYTKNIKFFDFKSKMQEHIDEKKNYLYKFRNKICNLSNKLLTYKIFVD